VRLFVTLFTPALAALLAFVLGHSFDVHATLVHSNESPLVELRPKQKQPQAVSLEAASVSQGVSAGISYQ
jgi:hypothetical protein